MFEQTFVDGMGKTHKSWTVLLSFAMECIAVGILVLIPLLWTNPLPGAWRLNVLTAPAPPPPAQPPPPRETRVVKVQRRYLGHSLVAPPAIPVHAPIFTEQQQALGDAVNGLDASIDLSGIAAAGPTVIQPLPQPVVRVPPPPADIPKHQEGPIRQSSGVQAAKCFNCPKPAYPPLAKQARIQGAVVLSAIIAKDGTVKNLTVVSSANPLLMAAAMDAVKKWVYIPTILSNEPVEVSTEITVNFSLR